jgi:hypothetical protein
MDYTYKVLDTLGSKTIIEVFLNGDAFEAHNQIIHSNPVSQEVLLTWADSVRQQTPEIEWTHPFNVGKGKFFGVSGHAVSHTMNMHGRPAQAKPTHVA